MAAGQSLRSGTLGPMAALRGQAPPSIRTLHGLSWTPTTGPRSGGTKRLFDLVRRKGQMIRFSEQQLRTPKYLRPVYLVTQGNPSMPARSQKSGPKSCITP